VPATCSATTNRTRGRGGLRLVRPTVAEAVADAKGFVLPEVVTINLDVPGEAHLPKGYVEADDARLEAYRRLAGVKTMDNSRICAQSGLTVTAHCRVPRSGCWNSRNFASLP